MKEEIILKPDKALEYVKVNVKKEDILELSYNRVFAPGEVLDVMTEEEFGEEELIVSLHLNGDLVNDVVRVNLNDIKDDLLEIGHITDEKETIIVIEDWILKIHNNIIIFGEIMNTKELEMDCDEAIDYIKKNVNVYDVLELSYNRVFTPGEVLNIDTSKYNGKEGLKVVIHVSEETFTSTVEVDLEEIKEELIEVIHIPKNKDETIAILIDKCDF